MNKFSQLVKHTDTDEWYTPAEYVRWIVPYLKRKGYANILCPFDTEQSEFVKVLKSEGFNVTYSHIHTGTDFYTIDNLQDYDAVVSNPPFTQRQAVLERLFNSGVPFAVILNFNGLFDSKGRWELFKDNDFNLLVPCGRMNFINFNAEEKASPPFQSIYVCRGMSDKQIEFIEQEKEQIEIDTESLK